MADAIITRAEAKAQGLKWYFTGKPCKSGHLSERRVSGGNCLACWDEWSAKFPEKMRNYRRNWRSINYEKALESDRKSRIVNAEALRKASKRWAAANRDRVLERGRRWSKRHPEVVAAKTNRRRARKIAAGGMHAAADLREILKLQNYRCVYCKTDLRKTKRHVDHILPFVLGGTNGKDNLQYLCASCNLAKGAKDPLKFAQEMGHLL